MGRVLVLLPGLWGGAAERAGRAEVWVTGWGRPVEGAGRAGEGRGRAGVCGRAAFAAWVWGGTQQPSETQSPSSGLLSWAIDRDRLNLWSPGLNFTGSPCPQAPFYSCCVQPLQPCRSDGDGAWGWGEQGGEGRLWGAGLGCRCFLFFLSKGLGEKHVVGRLLLLFYFFLLLHQEPGEKASNAWEAAITGLLFFFLSLPRAEGES